MVDFFPTRKENNEAKNKNNNSLSNLNKPKPIGFKEAVLVENAVSKLYYLQCINYMNHNILGRAF